MVLSIMSLPMPLTSPNGSAEGAFAAAATRPAWMRIGLWALVCWVTIFWRLSYLPLIDPDEAHYAQITREMRALGDYLVPRIDGVPIIDKVTDEKQIKLGRLGTLTEAAGIRNKPVLTIETGGAGDP